MQQNYDFIEDEVTNLYCQRNKNCQYNF